MFTLADMLRLYAEYGSDLVMFDAEGNGPYSANPADYFAATAETTFNGRLAIQRPVTYEEVE